MVGGIDRPGIVVQHWLVCFLLLSEAAMVEDFVVAASCSYMSFYVTVLQFPNHLLTVFLPRKRPKALHIGYSMEVRSHHTLVYAVVLTYLRVYGI